MLNRKSFIHSVSLLSGMLALPSAFANAMPEEPLLTPLIANRKKENSYWYMAHLMSVLLTAKDTGGRFALLRATERRGFEPPPHTHTKEDESFVILAGEAEYTVGTQQFKGKAGDVVFLPKNIQHSFKIQTETLETLIMLTPGGFENYFIEMSEPAGDVQLPPVPQAAPDIQKLISTASKYGILFPKH